MRPPGYEPGELPTAPLRDINHKLRVSLRIHFLIASAKVLIIIDMTKRKKRKVCFLTIRNIKTQFITKYYMV